MMLLLIFALLLPAQPSADALFTHGNARYDAGDYEGARAAYTQVIADGYASAALYVNLADAYFRLDSLGQSIRYLERARLLSPADPRVAHNLRITRARLGLTDAALPPPYWQTVGAWLQRNVPPWLPFGIGSMLFLAAIGLAAWRTWTRSVSPWVRRGLLVLLPPALLFLGLAFVISSEGWTVQQAAVLSTVQMESSEEDITLSEGRVVRVVTVSADRMEVELSDGTRGWVPSSSLGEI